MLDSTDAIERDAVRIRDEFLEMPGLVLTVAQTARLCAVSPPRAQALLETLEADGLLTSGPHGRYRRSTPLTGD